MPRLPDWLIYVLVLVGLLWALGRITERADAPPAPPPEMDAAVESPDGPLLPAPSQFDPEVMVEVGPVTSGIGTAFAIDVQGWWLTARHIVDDCQRVGLIVGRGRAVEAAEVHVARFADLALVKTDRAPEALALDVNEDDFHIGQVAFHVGFPQGRPGEAATRLIGRETLVARGRYELQEPVLAWAELGRTKGVVGTLAGMSGGPVFDAQGRVVGVTIAESARRGRIYTAAPASVLQLLQLNDVAPSGAPAPSLTLTNYGLEADKLRRSLAVAPVVCIADQE
jgi:S1-C subfamily serine protease